MLPDFPRLTRHAPAWFQISRDSQTLTCMLRSPCQTHLALSCVLPDSPGITDTLLQVSKLYRLNCASRSMLLQVSQLLPSSCPALAQLFPSSLPALSQLVPSSCPRCCVRVARVVKTLSQTLPDPPRFSQILPDSPRLSQLLSVPARFSYALPDSPDAP